MRNSQGLKIALKAIISETELTTVSILPTVLVNVYKTPRTAELQKALLRNIQTVFSIRFIDKKSPIMNIRTWQKFRRV